MALFKSKRVRELEEELIRVTKEKNAFESKVLEKFNHDGEFVNYLADKLELTYLQKSKLQLIFSVEKCRLYGIPEELICQYEDWEKKYQPSRES